MNELQTAFGHTTSNRAEIESSGSCGCCSCMEIFPPHEIVAWTGLDISSFEDPAAARGETAVCPRCGSEALIGDRSGHAVTPEFLHRMNQAWFQKTVIRRPASKL
jgi:hypothetical protein